MSTSSSQPSASFSNFQSLLDAALREYREKTGKDIETDPLTARLLHCDSSDAVLEILQEQANAFNQYRNGDWKVQLMRRLKPTIHILFGLSTSGAFGEGIGLKVPPAKAIFAGVGLLLAAAKGVSSSYDALIDLFECCEHYLNRLKVFTEIPAAVGGILVKIMVELLAVLALATQQINQGRFKKFAKKLLRGENDIEAVLQRLDRLTVEESRMTAAQTMEVVYGLFNNVKAVMEDGKTSTTSIEKILEALVEMQYISKSLNKMKRDLLQGRIHKWLSSPDPSINHNTACEAHHNGTAAWFLEGTTYKEWKATGSLLWTHGKPGSGKSVLCSSIIKDIEDTCATGLASVVYHYFDFKDAGKQDRRGFISSLLTQLCARSHHSYDTLLGLYEAHGNGLRQPSEIDLIKCLKHVLALPGQGTVYIVVDALDESPNRPGIPSPREKVLQVMDDLLRLRHANTDIRILITSRPEVDIRTVLEPLASQSVSIHDQKGQRSDIISYIKSVVESDVNMRKWRAEERELVIESLSQKADGMFRYVVCQLDTLRRCFPASIQRALGELPTTLDETYERILLEIDKEKHGHAIRLFQCLAFSCRPLRAKELAEILAIQFDARGFPSLNAGWRLGDAEEAVLSACSSLVTITELGNHDDENEDDGDCDPRVVQFSHYSVKEFLTSERLAGSDRRELSKFYVSSEPAHTILAQSCISTLLQLDLQSQDTAPCLPLSKYAARNWFHHAQSDGVASRVLDGMDRLFDPDGTHLAAWVSIHDIDDPFWTFGSSMRPISPLYYAVLCGINILVEHLVISRQQDPNASRGDRGTPLHVAVIFGYTIIARFLLGCSADVNVRDKYNSTPLHEASANGNLDIVILLLRHGADVNAFDHQGDPPVYKALQSRKLDIAEILLKGGADINAWDKAKAIPLHEILKRGDLDIVQWLRSHGADLNALDGRGDSPLHKALRILKFDVAEILIKGGADVNVRNKDNSTALHDALERANPSYTAQFLLGHGADANALDSRGDHPLHKTLRSQRFDIMEILVKGGADVNARGKDNVIPLHEALERGNLNILQLLLSHGADVGALDDSGSSTFYKALRRKRFDIAEILVKGGADVNARGKDNAIPLHEALERGNLDIMGFLLSHGADVGALDDSGSSTFNKALQLKRFDIAEILVKAGADVNARNEDSLTPLHEASRHGDLYVAKFLLRFGADVHALDKWGDSPLHKASRSCSSDVVELLVEAGADVNSRNKYHSTPLHEASKHKNLDIAEFLLTHGANIHALDNWGDSPLHNASLSSTFDMVKLLVDAGADVKSRNNDHSTPLHEASKHRNLDIAKFLLTHGANIDALDNWGDSPLHNASLSSTFDMVKLLVDAGADVTSRNNDHSTPLHEASKHRDLDTAKFLLSLGADVRALDKLGDSPLHKASRSWSFHTVALLVDADADVNARNKDRSTPLHDASRHGDLRVAELLLNHGADVHAIDISGYSPLHNTVMMSRPRARDIGIVTEHGYLCVAELLLSHGADVGARGLDQRTPLHLASSKGSLGLSRLLIEHGADVDAQDDEHKTPFSIALANGHRKLARFLSNDRDI